MSQIKKITSFIKEAFCVDGKCNFLDNFPIEDYIVNGKNIMKLTDSKRGTFYVAILLETELEVLKK